MAKLFDIMGNFPFKAEDKKPTLIRKSEYSTALYPPNNAFTSDNTFTMVTTDTFMLGIYELGPGGVFAPLDIHPGDESYYILNGPVVQRSGNGHWRRAVHAGGCMALLSQFLRSEGKDPVFHHTEGME